MRASFILLFYFSISIIHTAYSQPQVTYREYNTQEYMESIALTDPTYIPQRRIVESHFLKFRKNPSFEKSRLSLIFHIIFNKNDKLISETTINSQIDKLNGHFGINSYQSNHVSDPNGIYENAVCPDTEITFCIVDQETLDTYEVDANPINYIQTTVTEWSINNDIKFSSSGGHDVVLPDNLINIWICNLSDSNAGFSQYPGASVTTDGIVIDYQYINNHQSTHGEYDEGKSLSHLIANYLNLYDLWRQDCLDDNVSDTPLHNSPNYGCPVYAHSSTCNGMFVLEMTMNFMDNTNDECQYMFTNDQKVRLHSTITSAGPRNGLVDFGECGEISARTFSEINIDDLPEVSEDDKGEVELYPNPTQDGLWININNDIGLINAEIFNVEGKLLLKEQINSSDLSFLQLKPKLSPGIYTLKLSNSNYEHTSKIILQ